MMKFGLAASFLSIAAAPAAAQNPSPPQAPTPAIQQAVQAHGQCVRSNLQNVPATATPEAGAATVFAACAAQRQAVKDAVYAHIATLPEDQQAGAREQIDARLGGMETGLANMIRQQRGETPAQPPQ